MTEERSRWIDALLSEGTLLEMREEIMRRSLVVGMSLFSACLLFCGTAVASNALGVGSECDAVSDNIVANCGFETGDFRPEWTAQFGAVVRDAAHSGNFGMELDSQD